jgi:thiamine pyrophosphokinase
LGGAAARAAALCSVIIAADSGAGHALDAGLPVHHVVGDLDSIPASVLAAVEGAGAAVHRHPSDKDETDLELALDLAISLEPDALVVVGGAGGRLDHLLANVAVLGPVAVALGAHAPVEAWYGGSRLAIAVPARSVSVGGAPGSLVTLLALHGPAHGVRTVGLRWQLDGDALEPGVARGVSNELTGATAGVAVDGGIVTVIQPEAEHLGDTH